MAESEKSEKQRETIKLWIEEAALLRFGSSTELEPLSSYSDLVAPFQIVEQLTFVRERLDKLERLLIGAIRSKAVLKRKHAEAKEAAQDAWDQYVAKAPATNRRAFTQEYVTGKEKFADANLATLELQRAERKARELLSFAEEAEEAIKVMYRGLDSIRNDLLAQIRALQVESQLER